MRHNGIFANFLSPMRLFLLFLLLLTGTALVQAQTVDTMVNNQGHYYLRHIHISGTRTTRRAVILREMSAQEGRSYSRDSAAQLLAENKLRLANAALFTTINIEPVVVTADTVDWEVSLRERWFIIPKPLFQLADRNFNVWWTEQNRDPRRANFGLTLTDMNFRGNTERISVTAQVGYTQRFAVEYVRPYLDKRQRHGIGGFVNVSQSGEVYYNTDRNKLKFVRLPGNRIIRMFDAAVFYTYRPAFPVRHLIQASYHTATVADTVLQLNKDYFNGRSDQLRYAELLYRLDLNYADNWNYPLKGFKMVGYALARTGFKGLDIQAQVRTEMGLFQNPLPKWYTSVIFRGRLSLPDEQPYFFRAALGTKTDYLRGYEYYVMDGDHYGVLRFNLKRELLNTTLLELPFHYLPSIPLRVYPKVFADVGYMHDRFPGNSFLSNKMLYSAGIGLDIVTTYDVKIRLEFARNHLGENGLFLHLNSE